MTRLKTLHEKTMHLVEGRCQRSLCLYEAEDGQHVYGVEEDGEVVFTGTKAEAKAYYGRGW